MKLQTAIDCLSYQYAMLRHAKVPGNMTRLMTSILLAPGLKWNLNLVPRMDLTRSLPPFRMMVGTRVANKMVFGGSSEVFSDSVFFLSVLARLIWLLHQDYCCVVKN